MLGSVIPLEAHWKVSVHSVRADGMAMAMAMQWQWLGNGKGQWE